MAFKMRSGYKPAFKDMGSKPKPGSSITSKNSTPPTARKERVGPPLGGSKTTTPMQSKEYDAAAKKDSNLGSYVAERTRIKAKYGGDKAKYKASPEYKANQSKINKAYGIDDGYKAPETTSEVASGPTDANAGPETRGPSNSDSTKSTDHVGREITTSRKYGGRKGDKLKKSNESISHSTWDPETQTGSTGLGNVDTETKYRGRANKEKARRRTVGTADMGTDDIYDDAKVITKTSKRKTDDGTARRVKVKVKTPGVGTSKTKTKTNKDGTSTRTTRVRKKGQLFGRKVPNRDRLS